MAASLRELQGGSQRLGHLEQGPREEGVGGAGGRGAPHSSLLGRPPRFPWTCGHTQAQVHVGLFPGAPGQGRWPPLGTGGWAGAQDHSSNSTAPTLCRLLPPAGPGGDINSPSSPQPSVHPSGLKGRPQLSSGPSECSCRKPLQAAIHCSPPKWTQGITHQAPGAWPTPKPSCRPQASVLRPTLTPRGWLPQPL